MPETPAAKGDPLQTLIAELEAARETWRNGVAADEAAGRAGVIAALAAVANYLRAVGVKPELSAPLANLAAALGDAEGGRSNALLKPEKHKQTTPKKNIRETMDWASGAAAVTIWKDEAGWTLPKALKEAAKVLGITPEQLAEFRKNMGKGRAPKDAVDWYHFLLTQAKSQPALMKLKPEERGRQMLHVPRVWGTTKG